MTLEHSDSPPAPDQGGTTSLHDRVGAYAIGALPYDEVSSFEEHLAECAACRKEVGQLQAVSVLLPAILTSASADGEFPEVSIPFETELLDPEEHVEPADPSLEIDVDTADQSNQAPAVSAPPEDATSDPILPGPAIPAPESPPDRDDKLENDADVVATIAEPDEPTLREDAEAETSSGDVPVPAATPRPLGRVARGYSAPASDSAASSLSSRIPWIVGALGLLFGIAGILWALTLAEQKDNLQEEIDVQSDLIAEFEADQDAYLENTPALVFPLEPTTLGDQSSTGTIFADPAGTSSILTVAQMPAAPSGQTYRVWYLSESSDPQPGPAFQVDADGSGIAQLTADIAAFRAIGVTVEPDGGSPEPTTDPVLQGFLER